MTVYLTKDITVGGVNLFINNFVSEGYQTEGIFEEEFYSLDKSAVRNNFSEQEAINLIDRIRNELPMNQ